MAWTGEDDGDHHRHPADGHDGICTHLQVCAWLWWRAGKLLPFKVARFLPCSIPASLVSSAWPYQSPSDPASLGSLDGPPLARPASRSHPARRQAEFEECLSAAMRAAPIQGTRRGGHGLCHVQNWESSPAWFARVCGRGFLQGSLPERLLPEICNRAPDPFPGRPEGASCLSKLRNPSRCNHPRCAIPPLPLPRLSTSVELSLVPIAPPS